MNEYNVKIDSPIIGSISFNKEFIISDSTIPDIKIGSRILSLNDQPISMFKNQDVAKMLRQRKNLNLKFQKVTKDVGIFLCIEWLRNVDNVLQTFECTFSLYYTWKLSKIDIENFVNFKSVGNDNRKWTPNNVPEFKFCNAVDIDIRHIKINNNTYFKVFEKNKVLYAYGKLNVTGKFYEPLELENFPFDCQDIPIIIESLQDSSKIKLVPNFIHDKVLQVNKRYISIPEWHLEDITNTFITSQGVTSKLKYYQAHFRLKLRRKYNVYLVNVALWIMLITLMSFVAFVLKEDMLGDRLAFLITLLLTAVAFRFIVNDMLPNVPYMTYLEKYIFTSFLFIQLLCVQTGIVAYYKLWSYDFICFIGFVTIWVLTHIFWIFYAIYVSKKERIKHFLTKGQMDDIDDKKNILIIKTDNNNYISNGKGNTVYYSSKYSLNKSLSLNKDISYNSFSSFFNKKSRE